jgi:ketosteroid isomerase-like protein
MTSSDPTSTGTRIDPDDLPAVVHSYLTAHDARDVDTALAALTDDAVVVDEGHAHRGKEAIATWMRRSASEYTYTSRLTGARKDDAAHWVATHHLEGDFPGGAVDLDFRFTLRDGKVGALTIAP